MNKAYKVFTQRSQRFPGSSPRSRRSPRWTSST